MSIEHTLNERRSVLTRAVNERKSSIAGWERMIVDNRKTIEGYEREIAQIDRLLNVVEGEEPHTVTLTSDAPIIIQEGP